MKIGRPKIEDGEKKDFLTGVRFREDERRVLEKAAAQKGQTLSEWIRSSLFETAEPGDEFQPELPFESKPPRVLTVDEIFENTSAELFTIISEDRRIERKRVT